MLTLILLVFALALFTISAIWNPPTEPWWHRLVAAGLACWVLSIILTGHPL